MSDQVQFAVGHEPWQPSLESRLVEVFKEYDAPLLGLLEQEGNVFLFRCLVGELERANFWLYTRLDVAERDALLEAEGPVSMDYVTDLATTRPNQLALAVNGVGVIADVAIQNLEDLPNGADILSDRLTDYLESLSAGSDVLNEVGSSAERWGRITEAV
jgi:hypothetical protein